MEKDLRLSAFAAEGDWHLMLSRYFLVAPLTRGRRVLDLICGRGVGCDILRRAGADHVVGVDTREEVIAWAQREVTTVGLSFDTLEMGSDLPFSDDAFEVVVALNPARGYGDVHFREVRRVLAPGGVLVVAESDSQMPTLRDALPFYDRAPIGEAVAPADQQTLQSLFGQALVLHERPVLAMHYLNPSMGAEEYMWPSPDDTLLAEDSAYWPLTRLAIYGHPDLSAVGQVAVELPYYRVAERINDALRAANRENESVNQDITFLRNQLAERTQQLEELEAQPIRDIPGETFTATQERDLPPQTDPLAGWQAASPVAQVVPPRQDVRDAYVQELWQSATAWKEYAEQLQAEVERASQGVSEREVELSLRLDEVENALRESQLALGEVEREVPAMEAAAAQLRAELAERVAYIKQVSDELRERERLLDEFGAEMSQRVEELHLAKREVSSARETLAGYEQKKDKVERETLNLDQAVREKSARIQLLEREAVAHKIEISSLDKENSKLLMAKAKVDQKVVELVAQLASAQAGPGPDKDEVPPADQAAKPAPAPAKETAAKDAGPKRKRRKPAAKAKPNSPEQVEAPAVEADPKPRRTRRRRPAAPAATDEAASSDAAPKPTRRRRKPAAKDSAVAESPAEKPAAKKVAKKPGAKKPGAKKPSAKKPSAKKPGAKKPARARREQPPEQPELALDSPAEDTATKPRRTRRPKA